MNECLVYQLKPGRTVVGRLDGEKPAVIRLSGESILGEHCFFDNENGVVTLIVTPSSKTVSHQLWHTGLKLNLS